MREFLKEKKASKEYKEQKKFVLFDCGKGFKYRYGVMGTYCEMYKLTRYFKKQREACDYFDSVMRKTKDFTFTKYDKGLDKLVFYGKALNKKRKKPNGHRFKKQRFCAFKERS